MIGLSAGLEIARRALSAYQLAISVHGHNIANVDTPGYSRKRLALGEGEPSELSMGRVGLGVDIKAITRMRDRFLDVSYRKENSNLNRYDGLAQTLAELEIIFDEPGDAGFGSVLRDFWDSWQELANQPESMTSRTYVEGKATSLCEALNLLSTRLDSARENLDLEITGYVDEVNSLASRIAFLNGKIVRSESSGNEATDLRDQRDILLDELSGLIDVKVFEGTDGSVSVKAGTEALVERTYSVPLTTIQRGDRGVPVTDVTIGGGSRVISIAGGRLAGLLESRDEVIPRYISKIDELARTLVTEVNRQHRSGYGMDGSTGTDFFDPDGITAATIAVSENVRADVRLIAASVDGSPGSGDNALAVSDLRLMHIFGVENATADEFYSSIIGNLGIEASRASDEKEGQDLLLTEIETRRESVRGVSIDEEMANLVASQHAYQAAAKLMAVVDGLLQTIMDTL